MLVQRAYKTELALNDRQVTACRQHAGAARWAYNWGLRVKQERYQATRRSPGSVDLHREFNALKKTDVPWMYQVSKCAPQEALRNLDAAFTNFFRRCALKKQGKILSATVSEQAGHWYVSLHVEEEQAVPENTGPVLGIDLGIMHLATLSDGTVIENPRHLKQRLKKLKRLQRVVSRRQKGGKNRKKAVRKLARLHRKIKHQRQNTLQQVTTRLAKTKSVLVIEDLHVSGMLKNHRLAQAIGDVGFYEFKRQLLYKADWYGARVILANRWEPTSKQCSRCRWIDEELTLSTRVFQCQQCGLELDRDLNAAINLVHLAGSSSDSENACGATSAGAKRNPRVKLAALKQEPNTRHG